MNRTSKIVAFILSLVMVLGLASAFTLSASAETAPSFNVKQVSQEDNKVTVAVDLTSGEFNAVDFQFNTSDGVKCESINVNGGVMGVTNTANGKVSAASTNTYSTPGTFITATFTVPEEGSYSITGSASGAAITVTGEDGTLENKSVSASVSGKASGTTKKKEEETTTKKDSTTKKTTTTKKDSKTTKTTNKNSKTTKTTKKGDKSTTDKSSNVKTTEIDPDAITDMSEESTEDTSAEAAFGDEDIAYYDDEDTSSKKSKDNNKDDDDEEDDGLAIDPMLIAIIAGAAVLLIGGAIAAIVITNKNKNDDDYYDDDEE